MIVDFELVGILSVMTPSLYVSLSATFSSSSSSSSTDNDTRTFLSILDGFCLLSLSANVQDIADDNPEVDILLGKAREIDGPYQIVAAALCHFDS
jgi:hypothetical protein